MILPFDCRRELVSTVHLNEFAVVAYIGAPLGDFVDALRTEIVPSCNLRAHVTLLPPRPIRADLEDAVREFHRRAGTCESFQVETGRVEVFESSRVIYLSVQAGFEAFRELNRALNAGPFEFRDRYPFHPHVTLAQDLPEERFGEALELARRRWSGFRQARAFPVDRLTFVRNIPGRGWLDLAECSLPEGRPALTRTA